MFMTADIITRGRDDSRREWRNDALSLLKKTWEEGKMLEENLLKRQYNVLFAIRRPRWNISAYKRETTLQIAQSCRFHFTKLIVGSRPEQRDPKYLYSIICFAMFGAMRQGPLGYSNWTIWNKGIPFLENIFPSCQAALPFSESSEIGAA